MYCIFIALWNNCFCSVVDNFYFNAFLHLPIIVKITENHYFYSSKDYSRRCLNGRAVACKREIALVKISGCYKPECVPVAFP